MGAAPILGLEAPAPYMGMIASRNAQIALQCGVTGIIGSSNGDNLDVCLREAMILGLVEGPRIAACGHELMASGDMADGTNRSWFMGIQHPGLTRRLDGAEEFRHATREEIGRGCDVIKISAAPGHGSSPVRDLCYLTRAEIEAVVERGTRPRQARARALPVAHRDPRVRARGRRHHRPRRPDRRRGDRRGARSRRFDHAEPALEHALPPVRRELELRDGSVPDRRGLRRDARAGADAAARRARGLRVHVHDPARARARGRAT
jgi:hypothetical protein